MWLGHFIEHLMCMHRKENRAAHAHLPHGQKTEERVGRGEGIYRHLFSPGWWLEPGHKLTFSPVSSPQPGLKVLRTIGPSSWLDPGPNGVL